jgi:signal peptidase I
MSWDFALILFVLLVVTGLVWLLDLFYLRGQRKIAAQASVAAASAALVGLNEVEVARYRQETYDAAVRAPWWIEYSVSFFPVILFVFVLRSFLVEPFRIPSGSMLPTLQNGDLILVNKFQYGIRLPIVDKKIITLGSPQRGDVMVFRYPVDPKVDYIKRVVGLPGDVILYRDKNLWVNGKEVARVRDGDYFEPDRSAYVSRYAEQLGGVRHSILLNEQSRQDFMAITDYPYRGNCQYLLDGVECKVPPQHYFMMGDNRDNSLDSRYWGFVPDANIVGKAFFIWMNFSEPSRIGRSF